MEDMEDRRRDTLSWLGSARPSEARWLIAVTEEFSWSGALGRAHATPG